MSRNTARRLAASAAALVGAAAVSGCVSDPAFFETLAVAADTLASELAEDCYSYSYGYDYAPSYCAYGYDPYATVYVAPTYAEPRHHARDRDDHHRDRRQDRRRDRRRGGK